MKSVLSKALAGIAMLLSCSYSFAAITVYENTDTSSLVYGSYEFDDVLNTFSNITLKANFSGLQGPTVVDIDPDTLRGTTTTDGSRSDTYYQFSSGAILFKEFPDMLVVSTFERWEIVINGGVIDYVSGFPEPDFPAEFVYFTAKPGNVSSVPEPDVLSLLLISPLLLITRARKRQKS